MRLNSHAYISKLEADEEWVDIDYTDLTNSESLWSILDRVPLQDVPMDLTPEEYLHAILPSESTILRLSSGQSNGTYCLMKSRYISI